jgi:hypothetical protein
MGVKAEGLTWINGDLEHGAEENIWNYEGGGGCNDRWRKGHNEELNNF